MTSTSDETAAHRHDRMYREERDQAERLRSDTAETDHWRPTATIFRPLPDADDPAVAVLARWITPESRVIDVGAGGGLHAVPLAAIAREVVAVEPSAAMRNVLEEAARERGLTNLRIVPEGWETAEVEPADLVYAAHVTYSVADIAPFLRKMDRLATRRAALITFHDPAQHAFAPVWRAVHGEDRLRLPVRDELVAVLREMGIDPEEIALPPRDPQPLGPPDDALSLLRSRLFIGPRTPADARLQALIPDLTETRNGDLWLRDAAPNPISLLHWSPSGVAPHQPAPTVGDALARAYRRRNAIVGAGNAVPCVATRMTRATISRNRDGIASAERWYVDVGRAAASTSPT